MSEKIEQYERQLAELKRQMVGGTLIEFADGAGMTAEWGRANIADITWSMAADQTVDDESWLQVEFITNNDEAFFRGCWNITAPGKWLGPFFIFKPRYMPYYLLAPAGMEVPQPKELRELLKKIEDALNAVPSEVH